MIARPGRPTFQVGPGVRDHVRHIDTPAARRGKVATGRWEPASGGLSMPGGGQPWCQSPGQPAGRLESEPASGPEVTVPSHNSSQ